MSAAGNRDSRREPSCRGHSLGSLDVRHPNEKRAIPLSALQAKRANPTRAERGRPDGNGFRSGSEVGKHRIGTTARHLPDNLPSRILSPR